ncbi:MAG: hypothetical protein CL867_04505 [Cytophagaceae bacterium]|jgi:hypothetical protein|nr:hypothetical protein [Cytophagaceae bacterium]|tara:strand:+ start:271 stop:633 length:363 start_codon:yes stop_codon:yes gene_type:complete
MILFPFFLDMLYPLPLKHKKMFGVDAYYLEAQLLFALREKEENTIDNGIWIATKKQHHQKLKHQFKSIKSIESYGIKSWLMLASNHDHFEADAQHLAQLIFKRSELIGTTPNSKKRKPRN